MRGKFDDIVSVAIAVGVTALWLGTTLARWPNPFRLHAEQVEHINPLRALHPAPRAIAAANN